MPTLRIESLIADFQQIDSLITFGDYDRAAAIARQWAGKLHGTRETPGLNELATLCHHRAEKWWHDLETGKRLDRNKGELFMLIVSEIGEAMEGARTGKMDDKLPHRKMEEVELADAIIRICDYAGAYGFDLDGAVREKLAYNSTRADHSLEERRKEGGKKW